MTNIKLTDLTVNNPTETELDSFIQELSEEELGLQGGKRRSNLPTPIVSNSPTPVDSISPDSLPLYFANFYI